MKDDLAKQMLVELEPMSRQMGRTLDLVRECNTSAARIEASLARQVGEMQRMNDKLERLDRRLERVAGRLEAA